MLTRVLVLGVSFLPIQEQASTSDSGKGEGTGQGTEDTYAALGAGGPSLFFFLPRRPRGKHALAHARRYLAGDDYDNWPRDGESGQQRAGERSGRARGARRGSAEASGAEEPSGARGAGRARRTRPSSAAPPALAAARVYGFRALPRLRAALHDKIYFKTQLKETGRLHVTVSLTSPARRPIARRLRIQGGIARQENLGGKKRYKRGGGEGLGKEEGRGGLRSSSPASASGPHPRPRPAPASGPRSRRARGRARASPPRHHAERQTARAALGWRSLFPDAAQQPAFTKATQFLTSRSYQSQDLQGLQSRNTAGLDTLILLSKMETFSLEAAHQTNETTGQNILFKEGTSRRKRRSTFLGHVAPSLLRSPWRLFPSR
ncbi:uncharacterized protein LOC119063134 isoform X3 [Artibeus jamaicensis]|uniref:uncharacterized protein LOC119063134 isoform X3 n=2 Tax=Artibeus jamaicensis TaxID=9417 RepID=UPI00235B1C90|nr:uncharacterized protein LOC119063134 isoform X3 [Artibeus jamaicensis]XP_053514695.1 uncharacterized protein LOC119063134 isoform X3 [Artibeus jamaicensis]XP_053514700.1 uncharacterized protein LOC119063134 isoform X3 [Artibeus jamaicensis]